jgi:membrane fusion protein
MVSMPPGTRAAALLSLSVLLLLGFATWLVEVPQRVQAVGVLMPPGGFVRIVATQAGRVTALHVREGERVAEGQRLVEITSDGGAVTAGDSVPHGRLQSLRTELTLQRALAREKQRAKKTHAFSLEEQMGRTSEEWRRAGAEIDLHDARVALLGRRLERFRSLAADGNAAGAQLEEVRLEWLAARAAAEALHRQSARIEQERERLDEARLALSLEATRDENAEANATHRLQREIQAVSANVGHALRAPHAGQIVRITVRPGQPVGAGQTLATIRRGTEALEAWLYLPSTQAGSLAEGQAVELRFDAWPSRIFGAQAATIASISAMALMPSDLDVPLALPGPVFEIRASLERQSITAGGRQWPLPAGAAVRADLVQQRYRLYQWLLRIERAVSSEPADA